MESKQHRKQDISGPVAWALSISVHVGVALIAFFVTWSVIRDEEEPPRVVTSTWHEQLVVEEAVLPMPLPPKPEKVEPNEEEQQQEQVEITVMDEQEENVQDGLAVLHQIATTGKVPKKAIRKPETEVKFMGLDAVAAKRIVYVVDASGSMLLHLLTVIDELERSLRTLHPKQEFGILFFQKNKAIVVPPIGELVSANAVNINKAMRWIDSTDKVIPTGGSSPIVALKTAMRLHPDVIYLLSENIKGAGRYEVPEVELLAAINKLNPADKRNGLRKVQINCIQYLSQDSSGTMEKIAEIHGGDDGYTFIERGRVDK